MGMKKINGISQITATILLSARPNNYYKVRMFISTVCQCLEEGQEAKVWRSCKTPSSNSLCSLIWGVFFNFALGSKLQLCYRWVTGMWAPHPAGTRAGACMSRWHTSISPAHFFRIWWVHQIISPLVMYLNFFTVNISIIISTRFI